MSADGLSAVKEPEDLAGLLSTLGLLLHRWSILEKTLSEEIKRFRMAGGDTETSLRIRGSVSERLGEWRALISQRTRRDAAMAEAVSALSTRIERNRRDRNLITKDFEGVAPRNNEQEASISCGGPLSGHSASATRTFSLSELRALVQEIDACSDQLAELGAAIRLGKSDHGRFR
jgi:hypothetical protein